LRIREVKVLMFGYLVAKLGFLFVTVLIILVGAYFLYLLFTKAFREMGFDSGEAFLLLFASYIFGFNIFNIYLFTYNNWDIELNIGGALIPILLSIYLIVRKRISLSKVVVGVLIVSIVTYLVSYPDPSEGIVSPFPLWLLPAIAASLTSAILSYTTYRKAAPLAYISGVIGVLIGADVLHLIELLSYKAPEFAVAAIGGASVFDMVFLTGILAVIIDSILMFGQKRRERRVYYY